MGSCSGASVISCLTRCSNIQRCHVLRSEELLVTRTRELAVLLKRWQLADKLRQLRIGNAQIAAANLLVEHPLPDQLLEHRIANLRIVEHRRIEILASRLAHPILLIANGVREFHLADRVASDAGNLGGRAAAAKVIVDAEERERQRDERYDDLDYAFLAVNEIKHDGDDNPVAPNSFGDSARETGLARNDAVSRGKKGRTRVRPWINVGGVDGTRTRDPGVTGRTGHYFCFLISVLLAARSINFAQ